MSATLRMLWPLALLVLFLGTFRRADGVGSTTMTTAVDVVQLTELGDSYRASGRTDLAEDAYRRALAVDAKDGDLHVRLGELLLKRGDRRGAQAEAEAGLRWHPGSARALSLAARSESIAAATDER
jgi:tetratricopeptide (TPR) repeat protein